MKYTITIEVEFDKEATLGLIEALKTDLQNAIQGVYWHTKFRGATKTFTINHTLKF